jgi:integrase
MGATQWTIEMPRTRLTTHFVNNLADMVPTSRAVYFFDTEVTGFALELRPSGRATYYFRYRDAAKRVRLARIGAFENIPLAEARNAASEMKYIVDDGGDPKLERDRPKDVPSFADFVREQYMPHAKARKRSWVCDASLLKNHVLPELGNHRMSRIRKVDIISLHNHLYQSGYAAGTANRILILIRYIFNCAMRWEVLPDGPNPASGIEPFPDNGARERYLSQEEAHRLMAELDTNPNQQACNIIKLLLFTGARKTEIMHARWEYVDFERRLLTVPLSKSGKARHIALSDAALDVLRALPRDPEIPWLFWNPNTGRPQDSIHHGWDTIRQRAGIPDVRLHDLRHSFASFLVNSGRSLYEVQKLLGHSNAKTTQRYAHLAPGALIEAANIVGDLVQAKPRVAAE